MVKRTGGEERAEERNLSMSASIHLVLVSCPTGFGGLLVLVTTPYIYVAISNHDASLLRKRPKRVEFLSTIINLFCPRRQGQASLCPLLPTKLPNAPMLPIIDMLQTHAPSQIARME